ncbi:hypothetical protein [Streptomyces sp. TS71-3]|uniref:hypothetical protein n=1 Tax=Streptomyces sp. TS71-3 TaxID=2733862 RepID=UPI001B1FAB29|nr:hypothetical protein [Streptomyces sp. TS71-3]GHJ41178.1 hypothetical protein Sm713_67870 [Streptomyces sp. TS71-3]
MPIPVGPPSSVQDEGHHDLLWNVWHTLFHRKSRTPSGPTPQVQLLALAGLLDEAVRAQPSADRALAACGEAAPVTGAEANEASKQNTFFHHLLVRLRALRINDPDAIALMRRASRLISYYQWPLSQAAQLAHGAHEALQVRLNALAVPAADLRELRDEVRASAERACGTDQGPREVDAP